MVMMMMKTEMAAVFVNMLLLLCCCFITSTVSQEKVYAVAGEDFMLRLKNKLDSSERLYWKHNGTQIALIGSGKVLGEEKGLGKDGSLTLKDLKKGSVEVYKSEIYKGGILLRENTFIVHVLGKVQKPKLVATCEKNIETFKCQVPQAEGLTIAWLQDEEPLKETGPTLTRDPKKLRAESSFKCKVSNLASFEISQPVKKTCPVPEQPATKQLFGFEFWTMVGILAGGGGLVLLLIIVTIVLCTRARRRRHNRLKEEEELRLGWSAQQQQQQQQQQQHQHQHHHPHHHQHQPAGHTGPRQHRSKAPRNPEHPRSADNPCPNPRHPHPRPSPRIPDQGSRPAEVDEDQPPPLPQPRKKGPRTQRTRYDVNP